MNSKEQDTRPVPAPRLRFPGFVGEWEEKKLGEFLTESRLAGSDGAKARKITVKLWGKGVYEKKDKIQGSENTKYFKRRAGQLIYSKLDFLNGAFGIIPQELDGLESTLDLPCFDFSEGLNSQYILEYISREEFYSKFEGGALGGRKARRVTPEEFLSTVIPLPSLPEQTRIAAALSSLDAVIAAHQSKQDALREHKRGLMAGLFPAEGERVPRLRFPEFEGAGEWEEKKLGEVASYENGVAYEKDVSDGGKYVLVNSRFISNNGEAKKFTDKDYLIARKYDVLLVLSDLPKGRALAKCFHVDEDDKYAVNQRICRLTPKKIDSRYMYYIMNRNPKLLSYDDGMNQTHLKKGYVTDLELMLPSLPEQTRIAAALSSLDSLIAAQGDHIAALQAFKRGLMQGLFPAAAAGPSTPQETSE